MSKENKIRSGQILSPFGIGQIYNLPKEVSYMIGGLNLWDKHLKDRQSQNINGIDIELLKIKEERLQRLLKVEYFLYPFPYKKQSNLNQRLSIPCVRFPRWHYCTNSYCGEMHKVDITTGEDKIECDSCNKNGKPFSRKIPVRFVAVCDKGHIQDVPFMEWVHEGEIDDNIKHILKYESYKGSGDMGSIRIKCSCKKSKSLFGLMNVDKLEGMIYNSALARIGLEDSTGINKENPNSESNNPKGMFCKGEKPWLGRKGLENPDVCGNHLQVLIRGGSNIHYSNIKSALYLPTVLEGTEKYLSNIIERKTLSKLIEVYERDATKVQFISKFEDEPEIDKGLISIEDLLDYVEVQINKGEIEPDTEDYSENMIRFEEYKYILNGYNSENSCFKAVKKDFEFYLDKDYLKKYFNSVVLIEKLKETRVFSGFTRINSTNNQSDIRMLSSERVKWLPAIEVYGEGVFLEFNTELLNEWMSTKSENFKKLILRYHENMKKRSPDIKNRPISSKFIMIHTFAHLLIKRLCFNTGYGSSSLRERIYCSDDKEFNMNGVLIYTSSGDSEGSLGGLVNQGKEQNLGVLIKESIEDAVWCSSDPVCSEIGRESGQGPDNVNGAACHNCAIVPETSCEEFNMLIDRASVTHSDEIGYFDL